MEQLLTRIRDGLSRGAYPNERAVSTSIVVPILRALGWDDSDPEQVLPEYSTGKGRVDYALRCPPRPPVAFIEVKGVGRSVDADRQLFEYAFHEGVPLAILTDGREWSFYLPAEQGSYDERRVYQLVLDERNVAEIIVRLQRYLRRDMLASGDAIEAARLDYRNARSRREASRTMPKAWRDLLDEPDGLLIDLLLDRTEALCGYRPEPNEAEEFLRSTINLSHHSPSHALKMRPVPSTEVGSGHASLPPRPMPAARKDVSPPPSLLDAPAASTSPTTGYEREIRWRVGDQEGIGKNAISAFTQFVECIFGSFPDRHDYIVAAAQTRSRAYVARSPEAIYPSRPDLGAKASRELSNGLYLGTNLSNVEKLKLARQLAASVGLTFGVDANLDLNA